MAKFTAETKIQAVREYLAGHASKKELAGRYGVNAKGLQQWVELYRHHGEDGLRKRYTNYTAEFKLDVLNFMNDTGASPFQTAAVFSIPTGTTVVKWKEAVDRSGMEALIPTKKGRPPRKKKPENRMKKSAK